MEGVQFSKQITKNIINTSSPVQSSKCTHTFLAAKTSFKYWCRTHPRKVGVHEDLGGAVEDGGQVLALPRGRHGAAGSARGDHSEPYVTSSPSSVSILGEMKRLSGALLESNVKHMRTTAYLPSKLCGKRVSKNPWG